MGAVISKEEFGIVNVCFNLILRLTMKLKKREAVQEVSGKGQGPCCVFYSLLSRSRKYGFKK